MKISGVFLALFTLSSLSGCIAIPLPHTVVGNGNLTGRVIDKETKQPLEKIRIRIGYSGDVTFTDRKGEFAFAAHKQRNWWFIIPLLPFDEFPGSDRLTLTDVSDDRTPQTTITECLLTGRPSYFFMSRRIDNLTKTIQLGDLTFPKLTREAETVVGGYGLNDSAKPRR